MDWHNVVGITTRFGLHSPGIESQCGARFSAPVRTFPWATQPPVQWLPVLFWGGKAPAAWRWPTTPSSVNVKERVQLNLYSPPPPLGLHGLLWGDFTFYFHCYRNHCGSYALGVDTSHTSVTLDCWRALLYKDTYKATPTGSQFTTQPAVQLKDKPNWEKSYFSCSTQWK
jgi:hypothetical protein